MSDTFEPYYKWLGIPPQEQPPHHYRLLAIRVFEEDPDVIESAADRQMSHVRTFQAGRQAAASQRLLNELARASGCLLDPAKKAEYDAGLRAAGIEAGAGLNEASRPDGGAEAMSDGAVLGEYLLLDLLGRGGTGQVFKARHRTLGRIVALKILSAEATAVPEVVARFRRKVQIMARFDHPHLVAAYDAGQRDGTHYLVMEYVDGQDLGTLTKRFHPLPVNYVVGYIVQAARGLGYAHGHGIYHRNVKPSNILVDQQGVIKVIGLGLARVDVDESAGSGSELTRPGHAVGTYDFMAPEQSRDSTQVDERADVYSLGCTLHTLLAARVPYPVKSPMKKVLAHRQAEIPRLRDARPEVSDSLEQVFQTMMAKNPGQRYPSMNEVIAALQAIQHDLVQPAASPASASQDAELSDFLGWVNEREQRRVGR